MANVTTAKVEQKKRKRFIPLENDPEVMNFILRQLGVSDKLAFNHVLGVDDPSLLKDVPRPVHALLLVFPLTLDYEKKKNDTDQATEAYTGKGSDEPVVWYRQTIPNACGMIAVLHALSNGKPRETLKNDSPLREFVAEAISKSPEERAQFVYDSELLESVHQEAASGEGAPSADAEADLHFVCFIKAKDGKTGPQKVWELDGRRKGPIVCASPDVKDNTLADDEDLLSEKALDLTVRKLMKDRSDHRFSLIALSEIE